MATVTEAEAKQWWRCKGRNGSGCGYTMRSPIYIIEAGHVCPVDGKFRKFTLVREVKK